MATVRDTEQTVALFEGRAVLDPASLGLTEWVLILQSTLRVVSPKYLHGFKEAQDIIATPNSPRSDPSAKFHYSPPPYRIWFGKPGSSTEFIWSSHYLVCGTRYIGKPLVLEYLLLGRDGQFCALQTTWRKENDGWHFCNDTTNGHLKVRHLKLEEVVTWCCEDKEKAPYLLRGIIETLFCAAVDTENDLSAKLARATRQRIEIEQRLNTISWVRPGNYVWVVQHSHSWDRQLCNEYSPVRRKVEKIKNGLVYLADTDPVRLEDCFLHRDECRKFCPKPH